jgi:hypothetical protein
MVKIIIVDKAKNKKCTDVKKFKIEELYKKCNLRKPDYFGKKHTWKINKFNCYISVFAKDNGRANSESKFELPPPVDNTIYYGSMVLVKHDDPEIDDGNVENLTLEEFEKIYEEMFGGFEDLSKTSEEEEDELDNVPDEDKTKEGYLKDGFVVDDDEEEDDSDYIPETEEKSEDEDEEEDEEEDGMGKESETEITEEESEYEDDEESDFDSDVGSELSEESYVDSD